MKKTIKSANLHAINDLRYEDTPFPTCGDDEALVKIMSCGICGSDLSRVYGKGTYHFPTVIGHEFSGVVEFDPEGALTGKRVAIFPLLPCFSCQSCADENYATCENYDYYGSRRDGGMSEYLAVKKWNLLVMPDGLSFDEGAMCEPVSVARHAISKLGIKEGENLFISGAGPIGIIAGQWAKMFGAAQVYYIDIDQRKLDFARSLGFEEYQRGIRIDCALEGAGHPDALAACLEALKPYGRIVLMGNPAGDMTMTQKTYWHILRKEISVCGTWNSSYSGRAGDWKASLCAMAEGKIDVKPLITHKYPLSKCNEAFEMMRDKKEFYNKVMLNMHTEEN